MDIEELYESWRYVKEYYIGPDTPHEALENARTHARRLEDFGYEVGIFATEDLGGWQRGFVVYYRRRNVSE